MIGYWGLISFTLADEYYSSDLYRAVEQARVSSHHYDYSTALRYNRSTALSITLDPLLMQELAQTRITTAVDVAQRPDIQPTRSQPNEQTTLNNKDNRVLAIPNSTNLKPIIGTPSPVSVTVR